MCAGTGILYTQKQAILTQAIRSELKTQGVLGHPEVTMTALSPVWLDSRSRYLRDMYRPGMVMEQWNPETRSHDRYVIDRVTAQSHSLTLRDAQGETQVVRISSLDSSWSLFRPEKMPVADGERLRVTGKIPGLRVSGGDRLQVASVSEDAMTVVVPGRAEPATLPVADSPFTALKLENGWVETPGHSVSDSATVFASVTQMAMDNATLNGLARSGRDVRLYSSLDETRTAEKLARHPSFTVVSEQIKARAGETSLETAISLQKTGLHTPAQQAIHLALPVLESKNLAFSMVDLLTEAKSFAAEGTGFTELGGEINAQIKRGDLLYVDVAKGYGTGLLVSRASYEAEKSILRHILEGKEAVTPLMERVPGELMETLTSGQRAATRMILETSDRFTVVQGYAGVGKTTQFRAVMSAVNMLPASERPRVVGLGPTHRAVGEMRSAGVDAQTLASFLHDTQLQQRSGETPDFSNTLFLLDESSMVGNTDMARAYALIAAGGGRAVASGDTDQLQAIAPGQPFRLQQTRSAADVVIMKEIVRQTPELREAVYSLINRDVERALSGLESVKPSQVARDNPDSGVVVRIAGEGRPWNPGAITGGRVWGDIPDSSVQPGAGNGEPVTAEVLAQRQAEEAIRRETERRADEIVRKMAENKPDLPDGKTEQAVREIAGQERDRADITEREAALPESVLRESQREQEAVREVARENLLQERLQQIERDMVRDLQKEKTLGGD